MRIILTLLTIFLTQTTAWAQSDINPTADTSRIDASMITADAKRPTADSYDTIPASILKTSTQAADAIRLFNGLQVKDYGGVGGLKTVNVRSLGSEHTGVFIDGIAVDNAQNMQVDLGRFSTDNLTAITLSNGSGSADLLSARMYSCAASLSLLSEKPTFTKGKADNFSLRLRGGSFGTISPSFTWEHLFRKRLITRFNAEFVSSSGRYKFTKSEWRTNPDGTYSGYDTTMTRRNGDINSFRAEVGMFSKSLSNHLYFYDSERGLPGPVVRLGEGLIGSKDRQRDVDIFLQGHYLKDVSSLYKFKINWKLALNRTRYRTNPEEDPQALPIDNTYARQSAYLSSSNLLRLYSWWNLTLAADAQFNLMDSDLKGFVYPRRISVWTSAASTFTFPRTVISASLTYTLASDFFQRGKPSQAGGFAKTDAFRDCLTPTVKLSYAPFDDKDLSLTAFVKRSYRLPSFNDLYYTLTGNSSLRAETAMQYDLALSYSLKPCSSLSISAKVEGYRNCVRDKIIAIPTSSQFRWTMFNIGKAGITGIESTVSVDCRSGKTDVGVTLRYSFEKALDLSDPGKATYKGQIAYIPQHSGSAHAFVSLKGWRADYGLFVTGRRWSSSANISDYEIDPWMTHEVAVSKSFKAISLILAARNLMNERYEVVQGYPMPGLNFTATVGYSF